VNGSSTKVIQNETWPYEEDQKLSICGSKYYPAITGIWDNLFFFSRGDRRKTKQGQ